MESRKFQKSRSRTMVLTSRSVLMDKVPLPWRDNHPTITSDYELCVNRLKSLQRKLLKEPELIREYNQIIEEQLSKGIVERVAAEKDK